MKSKKVNKNITEDNNTVEMLKEKAVESFKDHNEIKSKASLHIIENQPSIEQVREAGIKVIQTREDLEEYRP